MVLLRLNYLAADIVTAILDSAQLTGLTRRMLPDSNLPTELARVAQTVWLSRSATASDIRTILSRGIAKLLESTAEAPSRVRDQSGRTRDYATLQEVLLADLGIVHQSQFALGPVLMAAASLARRNGACYGITPSALYGPH